MNHEPMPGRRERGWCPTCNSTPGPDCPERYVSKRTTRRNQRTEIQQALAEEAS